MNKISVKNSLTVLLVILIAVTFGCGRKEEAVKESPQQTQQEAQQQPEQKAQNEVPVVADKSVLEPEVITPKPVKPTNAAVSVDGITLSKNLLSKRLKEKMNLYKDKIPADKTKEVQNGLKKQLVEEFVLLTILTNEANSKEIVATDKEIQEAIDQIKANIPPDKKVEDFLKENHVGKEDIILGIRIKKLVELEAGKNIKPTQKEISQFYTDNKEKFSSQESVHVRHILVTIDAKDDETTKAEKKARIENLRKQVLDGADFAEIAKTNSDCPSKENGGDLGEIKKGQTVKPFEDAAFSQEINKIGPVVTTEFGHHVIQVLGHNPEKTVPLDEVKDKIAMFLEQQKQEEAFSQMVARLKKNASIVYYDK